MIREKYWIIQGRISLRCVLNGCFHCKKVQASIGQQKMANLPEDRVTPQNLPSRTSEWIALGPCSYAEEEAQSRARGMVSCLLVSQFVQYTLKLLTA